MSYLKKNGYFPPLFLNIELLHLISGSLWKEFKTKSQLLKILRHILSCLRLHIQHSPHNDPCHLAFPAAFAFVAFRLPVIAAGRTHLPHFCYKPSLRFLIKPFFEVCEIGY